MIEDPPNPDKSTPDLTDYRGVRNLDDCVEGVRLADLCDALAKNGYRMRSVALAHNWAAFRLMVNVAKRWLPDDVREKISRQ